MQASVSECNKCEGTGYLSWKQPDNYPIGEVEFCTCQLGRRNRQYWDDSSKAKQAKRLSAMFESAGIPPRFRDLTIESLAAIKDPGKQSAIAAARTLVDMGYIESPKGPKFGLVLSGSFGMGKTGLLTPVLRHWLDRGRSALWCEVYDFIDAIQGGYSTGNSDAKLEAAQSADIILLDDLGDASRGGMETDDRRRIIYQLINYRHNHDLPMLITTNLNGQQLADQFGGRTVERVIESCAWVKMEGQNLRMKV